MKDIFTKYKGPLSVLMIVIFIIGVVSYTKIQTALFPNITFPKIKIIADNGQQPVNKMMITVTKPLENSVKQVENLKLIRSITSMGSCEISAFLEWNTNIDLGKQRIESRIAQIRNDLPPSVHITIKKMNPSILPVMGYSLEGKDKSQIELKLLAQYTVKPFLSRIPGVSSIGIIGGKTKEYRIVLNPDKMGMLGITPQIVANAVGQSDFIKSNGYIVDYKRLYLTLTDAVLKNKKELEDLVVLNTAKRLIRIRDIATVTINARTEYVKINANGKDVPLVAVIKQPNANLIQVATQVTQQVRKLNKLLPKGVRLRPYYNQATFVNDSVRSIIDVLWIGLLLAMLVAIVFLRSLRASAVILVTIPITLSLTFIVLYSKGYTFNIMTLGAIAASIGLIIDDAIVVIEQIHRTREENPSVAAGFIAGRAVHYLFPAMVGSSLSTIVILVPFFIMSGVAGAYFSILTTTMIITLLCSFIVTWIGLPVIYLLISKKQKATGNNIVSSHPVKNQRWVGFFTHRPTISLLFILFLALSIYFIIPKLKTGFLPHMDEGSIVLDYSSPPGTSLEATTQMLKQVDQILSEIPEVVSFSRRTGTQMGFFITEPNKGDYLIQLARKKHRTTAQVSDDIRKRIEATIPALIVDFGQVITDMLGDLMSSVQPIEIKIFGEDHNKLKKYSKEVAHLVSGVQGTADVFDGITIASPVINIKPNESVLAQYNLTPADLQFQIQTQLNGSVIGSVQEKEQLTDVRMIYPEANSTKVQQLKHTRIFLPDGKMKPINEFADININSGMAEIQRENLQTMGVVTARLNQRDLGSVIRDIKEKLKGIRLPSGYQIIYGGSYAEQQQSFNELLIILLSAGLLVFTLILFLFKDIRLAALIIILAFLGTAGSLWAVYLTKIPLNVGSYTGLIMIVGIIGENAIFTVHQFLTLMKKEEKNEAIIQAISIRLRPNLMTATGAILALMPLALGIGTGAQMHQPLAIAVIGGFLIAIPLLLVVLPTFLQLFYRKS